MSAGGGLLWEQLDEQFVEELRVVGQGMELGLIRKSRD